MLAINKTTAAKLIVLWNLPALLLLIGAYEVGTTLLTQLTMASSNNSPKNWSEWNNTKHFTDYSRDSGTGKFVRFTIAALLFIPVGFLTYMTTFQYSKHTKETKC